jgi:MFS family permease
MANPDSPTVAPSPAPTPAFAEQAALPGAPVHSAGRRDGKGVASSADEAAYPSRVYAWYVVSLLTLAYAISLLDRWILSLLVGPVKAHFGVSDTQMGLLMGFWFAVFYVTMGLPFGWLADRFNRRTLVGAAMLFWCSMTAFCGLAKSFGQLSAARLGIGLGEAALTPAANSIIADYFPRDRQNSAITFFNMGISTGMGIAYLAGGLIVGWMATQPPLVLPVFGRLETWQVVFLAAGAPGLVVAGLILLTIREPLRRGRLARSASEASLASCMAFMKARRGAYLPLFVGMAASPLAGYAWQWLPTLFDRVWGWKASQFSFAYGCVLLVCGPLGAISGGVLATRLYRAGHKDAPFLAAMAAMIATTLISAALPYAPSPEWAVALLVPASVTGAMGAASGAAAAVFMTPGEFRAQVSSIYVLTINGIGLLVGPTAVGWLNDHVFTAPDGVRASMALVVLVAAGALTIYLASGRRAYREAVEDLEARAAAAAPRPSPSQASR